MTYSRTRYWVGLCMANIKTRRTFVRKFVTFCYLPDQNERSFIFTNDLFSAEKTASNYLSESLKSICREWEKIIDCCQQTLSETVCSILRHSENAMIIYMLTFLYT